MGVAEEYALNQLCVSGKNLEEFFDVDLDKYNLYEDECYYLEVACNNVNCQPYEFNLFWEIFDENVKGFIKRINTSSVFAANMSYWQVDE